jgi:hypothetical protein
MTVEGFGAAYARAKELQAHAWSDELAEVADDDSLDPQVLRVKFDIKKWLMCNEGGSIKLTRIQLCDKVKALDMLARHLGMFSMSERRSRRPKLSAR